MSQVGETAWEFAKTAVLPTVGQDWGSLRGQQQGKRAGGQVVGGMRDVSLQGIKYYSTLRGAECVTQAIYDELRCMEDENQNLVVAALQHGCPQREAFLLGYLPWEEKDAFLATLQVQGLLSADV